MNGKERHRYGYRGIAGVPRNALAQIGSRHGARAQPSLTPSESYTSPPIDSSEYTSGGSAGSGVTPSSVVSDGDEVQPPPKHASGKDEIVHFDWQPGMIFNLKYELKKALGDGTFGRVVLAHDRRNDRMVAIKIIRDVKRYMENAKIEASILKDVAQADPKGTSRCAIMLDTFTHERKFYCLVFEPLGVSLYDFMKKNVFRGFWMRDIQSFAKQCMQAMCFLHTKLHLAHTDLKPENILLESTQPPRLAQFFRESDWKARKHSSKEPPPYVRPADTLIKIIDFGNATYENEHHSSIINTRQYRGPEVLLETQWNELSDIWSLGCIFLELYSGELLFGTHENVEHLALMEKVVAPFSSSLLEATPSQVKQKYLQQDAQKGSWQLDWPAKASSRASQQHVRDARTLEEIVHERHHKPFLVCARSMLTPEASRRPSAAKVLEDPFFSDKYQD